MQHRFGDYDLDDQLYELRRAGAPVELERKVYDVLAYLIQHRDRLVTKDELLEKLWPGQVVGEAALTRCITSARKALGDDGNRQEFIKTQYGRGYRFVAAVAAAAAPGQSSTVQVSSQQEANQKAKIEDQSLAPNLQHLEPETQDATLSTQDLPSSMPRRFWPRRSLVLLGILGIVVGVSAFMSYWSSLSPQHSALSTPAQPVLPLPDKPSIIVLPFTNLSGDPTQEYFSDGMTEEITSALSRLSSLFVIARTSAFFYKDKQVTVQDISREMGVRYVLEGSVRKAEAQIRIIAQLVDATTGEHLWSEHYDRPLKDIFALQDEIVQKIVATLRLQLTLWEKGILVRKRTDNLEAYDDYLRGTESLWRAVYEAKKEVNVQARQMFEKAIELDPQYAEAYTGLGFTHFFNWFYRWSPDLAQAQEQAFQATQQAVVLEDSLPMPHQILGQIYLWRKQHDQAITEAERAVALAPNDADSYLHLGNILTFAGRLEEALEAIKQAMRLNPRYPSMYLVSLALAYRVAGRCDEALALLQRALTLTPHYQQARTNLAMCYAELGRLEETQAEVAEILRINPSFSLEWVRQTVPFKDPAIVERMVAALRKAGLK